MVNTKDVQGDDYQWQLLKILRLMACSEEASRHVDFCPRANRTSGASTGAAAT
jgi:hypothetical protein